MRSIGVRELRQNASRYLRLVEAGETIKVTDRGRPVAHLVPVPGDRSYEQLVASGRIRPGAERPRALVTPLEAIAPGPSLSEVLAELRDDER